MLIDILLLLSYSTSSLFKLTSSSWFDSRAVVFCLLKSGKVWVLQSLYPLSLVLSSNRNISCCEFISFKVLFLPQIYALSNSSSCLSSFNSEIGFWFSWAIVLVIEIFLFGDAFAEVEIGIEMKPSYLIIFL